MNENKKRNISVGEAEEKPTKIKKENLRIR